MFQQKKCYNTCYIIVLHGFFLDASQRFTANRLMNDTSQSQTHQGCDHIHTPGGHTHSHGDVSSAGGRRRVAIAGVLTGGFMMAEVAGGLVSGSLALLADAAHMLTDAASLGLAWFGYKLAARPESQTHTFGYSRMRILAAFINGLALLALAVWITVEGLARLMNPQPVIGPLLLGVAILGLSVNLICFYILVSGDHDDLNLRGAILHVAGDLLGSLAAIAAAIIIIYTGWLPIDPLLSMLVAVLIAVAGWRVTREAGHILAQGAPKSLSPESIISDLCATIPGLSSVQHIHLWSLTEKENIASLEARIMPGADPHAVRDAIKARLRKTFAMAHATIEIWPTEEAEPRAPDLP